MATITEMPGPAKATGENSSPVLKRLLSTINQSPFVPQAWKVIFIFITPYLTVAPNSSAVSVSKV